MGEVERSLLRRALDERTDTMPSQTRSVEAVIQDMPPEVFSAILLSRALNRFRLAESLTQLRDHRGWLIENGILELVVGHGDEQSYHRVPDFGTQVADAVFSPENNETLANCVKRIYHRSIRSA